MKSAILIPIMALGLAQGTSAATGNLFWAPTDANWNTTTANWYNTNLAANVAFANGDSVIFDNSGSGQPAVTLVGTLSPSAVLVEADNDYSLASTTGGKLSGALSLIKKGAGKLTLDADNAITGATDIEAGLLQIGNGASRGAVGTGPITNMTGLIISRTGTLNLNNYLTGSGSLSIKLGATVNIWGTNTMNGPILIQIGMLSLSNAPSQGSSTDITLDASTGGTANARLALTGGLNLPAEANLNMMGTMATGPTRCTLQNTAADTATNSVNGQILIGSGDGLIQMNGLSTSTGLLRINGNIFNHSANLTPFSGSYYLRGNVGNGALYGSFNLPDAKLIKEDTGTWTIYSSGNSAKAILVSAGTLRLGANNALPNVEFSMGKSGVTPVLDLGGFNQQITTLNDAAGLPGTPSTIGNSGTTSDSVLTLSGGGQYGGSIQDVISPGNKKVGITLLSGAQQLTANCSYSGPTTILGGGISLVGSGSIPNTTPIQFADGAAIDVRFKSDATLTLQAAQILKGDGTFHVNGNLASQGTIELKLNKSGDTLTKDRVSVDAPYRLTYGGILKLDLSGDQLTSADSVQLFSAGSYSGAFSSIIPATPGAGLAWNTNSLTTDGTLRIDASIPTAPTNITFSVAGEPAQLEVAWPAAYQGWTLQGQTNAPNAGLTANWYDVPESATTNRVFITIDPANGSVFYRLRYQP